MEMTYQETLDYMYSQLPMYQRQGAIAFKKDLTNIKSISKALGNPHQKFESIHIAGTNGKGTVAHMIAGALQAHGLRVGMYTSPHYLDFRERIKINGRFISEDKVIAFVGQHKALFEEVRPSFFEMTVAMAFQYFADERVDIAIIETGLGGRLDSTNIITPIISVITNISFDHQNMLGDTLPLIAAEKAGIIKKEVPVVIGEYSEEVHSTFADKARDMQTNMNYADSNVYVSRVSGGLTCRVDEEDWLPTLEVSFVSSFFIKNIKTAISTLHHLRDKFQLQGNLIARGIETMSSETYYIGRFQKLGDKPLIIADSAHNIAGVQELLDNIKHLRFSGVHIVIGMVNDKDISNVLQVMPSDASYYFAKADIPRGLPADQLKEVAAKYGLSGNTFESVPTAYKEATELANDEDLVLVMGSIFVVAEVLAKVEYITTYK